MNPAENLICRARFGAWWMNVRFTDGAWFDRAGTLLRQPDEWKPLHRPAEAAREMEDGK